MLAKDLISDVIPALKKQDTGAKALNWMEVFRVSHLPVVNNNMELAGMISDNDIYDQNISEKNISEHKLSLMNPFVTPGQHIYDVIRLFAEHKLTTLPVVENENKQYRGLISHHELLHNLSKLMAVKNQGGIIILELNIHDYSLTEIAQIVEGNDVKILSLYVSSPDDSTELNVTIKVNSIDLSRILQSFERYNYHIKASFTEEDELGEFFMDRFKNFMKYLDV